ncbi:MAG: aldo/keto reductase [Anaerolineae bacterium]|jgi:aryl-alcohol dehydrogenase-like predicted oxidoreductase
MKYRALGKTGFEVSEVSLGTWQVGGRWGEPFSDENAEEIINRAIDLGVNFIDTADVYGGSRSEAAVARVVKARKEEVRVATKCGRRISPHVADGYTVEALEGFVDDSLKNMGVETIDLIQLHCPPTEVYYRPEIFALFDRLKQAGKIRNLGVSVEKVEEAIKAIEYPNITTVQIIFNMFRHRPADLFFSLAKQKNVGVIVRVPLASGLLSGKITRETTFGPDDHRTFNRDGAAFDKGETFSGVDFETGLQAVEEIKALFPADANLAQWALRWVLMFDAVSCVIPGASKLWHVESNVTASDLHALTDEQMAGVKAVYEKYIKNPVHYLW